MSVHLEQVASVLQRAVQDVLSRGLNDPRVRGLISVTRVEIAADLANATVFVSIMPEEYEKTTLHGLQSAARHIRREAAEKVVVRKMPLLAFKVDRTLKKESQVLAAIAEARRADEARLTTRAEQPAEENQS